MQPEKSDEPAVENEDLVNDGVHLLDEDLHEDIIIKYRTISNKRTCVY